MGHRRVAGWLPQTAERRRPLAHVLLSRAQEPLSIAELLSLWPDPDIERAVTYHLMWHHRLHFDLTCPLRDHTQVWAAPVPEHA